MDEPHPRTTTAPQRRALASDYDSDPARFAANERTGARYSRQGDLHPLVADTLAASACARVLDLGAGTGHLARLLAARDVPTVALDTARHVAQAPPPRLRAEATALPFRSATFDAAAALWMLYHLPDPVPALREARRVLRPGGVFVACASSRTNDPELAAVLPGWGTPTTFDAEDAADVVGSVFEVVDVVAWDRPMVDLPDSDAVATCLRGRGLGSGESHRVAQGIDTPITVTKRGALVWARAPG